MKDPFELGQPRINNNIDEGIGLYSPSAFINGSDVILPISICLI